MNILLSRNIIEHEKIHEKYKIGFNKLMVLKMIGELKLNSNRRIFQIPTTNKLQLELNVKLKM